MTEEMAARYDRLEECFDCPVLAVYRADSCRQKSKYLASSEATEAELQRLAYHAHPVAASGPIEANFLIVGLAPGYHGANRTGVPFAGDDAGELLYKSLYMLKRANKKNPIASDLYFDTGFSLKNTRITNTVKCVPPNDSPSSCEFQTCSKYLEYEIRQMGQLRYVLTLGRGAHKAFIDCIRRMDAVITPGATGYKPEKRWTVVIDGFPPFTLMSYYHPSRRTQIDKKIRMTTDKLYRVIKSLLRGN